MPLHIIRNDIVTMAVDAIVSAANTELRNGGGVNGRIHRKAGALFTAACQRLGGCRVGQAVITKGYDLPAKYVIHTVGPVWRGGNQGEEALLRRCYTESLTLAAKKQLETIAFPLISTGQHGYPKEKALPVATGAIRAFLEDHPDMTVYLVVFDRDAFALSSQLFERVEQFVDEAYVDVRMNDPRWMLSRQAMANRPAPMADVEQCAPSLPRAPHPQAPRPVEQVDAPPGLEQMLARMDEGFSQTLLRLIDERGMKDADCYKRANIDRKHFSKIRSNPAYQPKKTTAVALAIALRLSLEETRLFIGRAGHALSRASVFDVIVEFFISNGLYDIDQINQVLWAYDMPTLGV